MSENYKQGATILSLLLSSSYRKIRRGRIAAPWESVMNRAGGIKKFSALCFYDHQSLLQSHSRHYERRVVAKMKANFVFNNLCGTVYRQGNVVFTPDGNSVLSPVGNRVSVFDLVKWAPSHVLSESSLIREQ